MELEAIEHLHDREKADKALRALGLNPGDVVLELTADESELKLSDVKVPVVASNFTRAICRDAVLTATIPVSLPEPAEELSSDGRPLYRISLDIAEGALPSGAVTSVQGLKATSAHSSF